MAGVGANGLHVIHHRISPEAELSEHVRVHVGLLELDQILEGSAITHHVHASDHCCSQCVALFGYLLQSLSEALIALIQSLPEVLMILLGHLLESLKSLLVLLLSGGLIFGLLPDLLLHSSLAILHPLQEFQREGHVDCVFVRSRVVFD